MDSKLAGRTYAEVYQNPKGFVGARQYGLETEERHLKSRCHCFYLGMLYADKEHIGQGVALGLIPVFQHDVREMVQPPTPNWVNQFEGLLETSHGPSGIGYGKLQFITQGWGEHIRVLLPSAELWNELHMHNAISILNLVVKEKKRLSSLYEPCHEYKWPGPCPINACTHENRTTIYQTLVKQLMDILENLSALRHYNAQKQRTLNQYKEGYESRFSLQRSSWIESRLAYMCDEAYEMIRHLDLTTDGLRGLDNVRQQIKNGEMILWAS